MISNVADILASTKGCQLVPKIWLTRATLGEGLQSSGFPNARSWVCGQAPEMSSSGASSDSLFGIEVLFGDATGFFLGWGPVHSISLRGCPRFDTSPICLCYKWGGREDLTRGCGWFTCTVCLSQNRIWTAPAASFPFLGRTTRDTRTIQTLRHGPTMALLG